MKKIISVLVTLVLLSTHMFTVVCANDIHPRWDNTALISCQVTFQQTNGTVYCSITGDSGVTKIEGTLILYEGNNEIMSWNIEENDNYWSVLYAFTGKSGKTYTLELIAEVYKDGIWEPITTSDSTRC